MWLDGWLAETEGQYLQSMNHVDSCCLISDYIKINDSNSHSGYEIKNEGLQSTSVTLIQHSV